MCHLVKVQGCQVSVPPNNTANLVRVKTTAKHRVILSVFGTFCSSRMVFPRPLLLQQHQSLAARPVGAQHRQADRDTPAPAYTDIGLILFEQSLKLDIVLFSLCL